MEFWIWALLIIALYFAPTITAYDKKKKNTGAIFALNFFLGWTLVGWVVALVWATTVEKEERVEVVRGSSSIDDLHKLAELKEKGLISEEEFNKKKQQVLG